MNNHPFTDPFGRPRQLVKHHRAVRQHASGLLDAAGLARKPWFIRLWIAGGDRLKSLGTADTKEALRLAKRLLRDTEGDNNKLTRLLDESAQRSRLTVGTIAAEYQAAGYPDRDGRPRTGVALRDETRHLAGALEFFASRHPAHLSRADSQDYLAHVRQRVSTRKAAGTSAGCRTAELDLISLGNCLEWAVSRGRIATNPLAGRKRFRAPEDIAHHRLYQPQSGDELHAVSRWLWTAGHHEAAARVLYHALTGQRPGEAAALRWHHPGMLEGTPGFRGHGVPITLGYLGDGANPGRVELLHVHREKGGINPAVVIHPSLRALLDAWRSWSEHQAGGTCVGGQSMFPAAAGSRDNLSDLLNTAARALGGPANRFGQARRTAHALRAFYVSVRRSQGAPDLLISTELGQGTGAQMVRTYGAATDVFGSGRISWLPSGDAPPAWQLFCPSAAGAAVVPFRSAA